MAGKEAGTISPLSRRIIVTVESEGNKMEEKHSVSVMWSEYVKSIGKTLEEMKDDYTSWYFGADQETADELAQLVLSGTKKATASLHEIYTYENEPIPKVGDYSVITDWEGEAKCIIKTTAINICPFKDVTEAFAKREGEGDKSLAYWRDVHRHFFGEECKEMKKAFHEDMLVICEEFEVVFPSNRD